MEKEQNIKFVDNESNAHFVSTTVNFTTKQPGGVPILNLLEWQARNLLTFLVVA